MLPAVRRTLALLVVLSLGLLAVTLPATAQSSDEGLLETAKRRVAEVTRQLESARDERSEAASALAGVEEQLRSAEAAVNEAAAALERQQTAVVQARSKLTEFEQREQELEDALAARAADVYKKGSGLPYALVLASSDVDDALERSEFLRVITESDAATLEDVTTAQIAVTAQRERLAAEVQRLERMKTQREELFAQVEELHRVRAEQLAAANEQVSELEEQHDELEEDQKRIERLIEQNKLTPAMASAPSTSGYVRPLCRPTTSEYGRRWGRMHAGLDIDGVTGDPIGAAKGGVVIFAGWQSGYGKMTLVDHGDGVVTAYAHQSAIRVGKGQRVERGERIGSVGNTGRSTGSHLHFETRVNGNAVNPRRFLPSSC